MQHRYISRTVGFQELSFPDFDDYLQNRIRQMKSELLLSFEDSDLIALVFRVEYGVEGYDPPSHRREKTLKEAVEQAKHHRMNLMIQIDAREISVQFESFRTVRF